MLRYDVNLELAEFAGFGFFLRVFCFMRAAFLAAIFFPFFCEMLTGLYFFTAMGTDMSFFCSLRTHSENTHTSSLIDKILVVNSE